MRVIIPAALVVLFSAHTMGQMVGAARPAPPPQEFDAADIKPSESDETERTEFLPGGRITFRAVTLRALINMAWNLRGDDTLRGAPAWLATERFDVLAKAPLATRKAGDNIDPPVDIDALRLMTRALLQDRFRLKVHSEQRPALTYVLVAAGPKLKPADPTGQPGCKQFTAQAGLTTVYSYSCQNTTLAKLAEILQNGGMGDVDHPVIDATGMNGNWDFTLSWTPQVWSRAPDAAALNSAFPDAVSTDPRIGLTLAEALERQLGLKLELRKRSIPVIVIDHIDPKPTDN